MVKIENNAGKHDGHWFWKNPVAQSAALVLAILAVYLQAATFDFVNHDDPGYVSENPHVTSGLTVANVTWAWRTLHGGISYWHPLTWMSHQLDCTMFGLRPGAHHLTSVWLHAANAVLLLALLRCLGLGVRTSFFTAGFFALHPLHVESVAWIAERKDVLYTFFWLTALACYWKFRTSERWVLYGSALGAFALACMCKPTAVTLPIVLIVLEVSAVVWKRPDELGQAWIPFAPSGGALRRLGMLCPFLVLAAAATTLTYAAQVNLGAVTSWRTLGLSDRLDNAVLAYAFYIQKTLWPTGLAVSQFRTGPASFAAVCGAWVSLIGITMATVKAGRRDPWIPVGWFWFLVTLLPNIGLVQAGPQTMADRYSYVPLIGLFVAILRAAALGARSARIVGYGAASAFAVLTLCATLAFAQTRTWTNSTTLFTRAATVAPDNWIAQMGLGMALTQERQFDAALPHLQRALSLPGNVAEAHRRLAVHYQWRGDDANAKRHCDQALELDPDSAETCYLAAALLDGARDPAVQDRPRALALVERGLQLRPPVTAEGWAIVAQVYRGAGRAIEAQNAALQAAD